MDDPLVRFTGVYDQCYRTVLRYLLQHAEQGTAEDVASETFLIAWRRFPAIPDPLAPSGSPTRVTPSTSSRGPIPAHRPVAAWHQGGYLPAARA
ncbi:MAG TPA: hypothetical protein VH021_14250 [Trebonia sp.]|nr:hypothetical protein [Trebonia sp.]